MSHFRYLGNDGEKRDDSSHTHTLKKYAAAGAIALGLTLTANSSAWAEDVQVTEVPSTNAFNAAWDAAKGVSVSPQSHISGCVQQTITFPEGSAWSLCVKAVQKFGVVISHAAFRKSASPPFITVLFDARLGEIFVPYHPGSPRFGDICQFNFFPNVLTMNHCPPPRVLIDGNRVCREICDSGIAAMNDAQVHRGHEVVYFASLDAANYNYILEFSFRHDGTIATRAGSTGPKLGGANDTRGHSHTFTWRFDIDLNGSGGDSVCLSRHIEPFTTPLNAIDRCDPINTEAGLDWNPLQYNTINITDATLRNGRGRKAEYEIIPQRTGTQRHAEAFTRHDFWVTRFAGTTNELLARDLPSYLNGQSTASQDLVEWYTQSVHHEDNERDEKRATTPVIYTGFEIVPNNLYDSTPFFP